MLLLEIKHPLRIINFATNRKEPTAWGCDVLNSQEVFTESAQVGENRLPFCPEKPIPISQNMNKSAIVRSSWNKK